MRYELKMPKVIKDGVKIHTIKPAIEDTITYSQQIGYIVNAFRKGLEIIKRNNIEIIHANTYSPVFPAVILGLCSKAACYDSDQYEKIFLPTREEMPREI